MKVISSRRISISARSRLLKLKASSGLSFLSFSYKDNLISDGVLNVSKKIERAGFNHNRKKAAFRMFTTLFHSGKRKKKNTRKFLTQDFIGRIEANMSRILSN